MGLRLWLLFLTHISSLSCWKRNVPVVPESNWHPIRKTSSAPLKISDFVLKFTNLLQIWENLNKSSGELARKRMMGWIWLIIVCFINTVPLFFISVLANLSSLTAYVGFLSDWQSASPHSFNVISGVLPSVVSALFGFFLPITMRWLSRYMGVSTHSRLDRTVLARYFAFLIISQLIVFTLIGVIFSACSFLYLFGLVSLTYSVTFHRICHANYCSNR